MHPLRERLLTRAAYDPAMAEGTRRREVALAVPGLDVDEVIELLDEARIAADARLPTKAADCIAEVLRRYDALVILSPEKGLAPGGNPRPAPPEHLLPRSP